MSDGQALHLGAAGLAFTSRGYRMALDQKPDGSVRMLDEDTIESILTGSRSLPLMRVLCRLQATQRT